MGFLAADSDGCCAGGPVMSWRPFSSLFSLGIGLRGASQSLIYERAARIRTGEVLSGRVDVSSAVDSQAGGGL